MDIEKTQVCKSKSKSNSEILASKLICRLQATHVIALASHVKLIHLSYFTYIPSANVKSNMK